MSPAAAETSRGGAPNLPGLTNGKAGAAPPKVTGDGTVELENMDRPAAEEKLPLHEDFMQLARLGEIGPIQKLFEEGKYDAKYKDQEGITPLHVCEAWSLEFVVLLTRLYSGQQSTTITCCVNT